MVLDADDLVIDSPVFPSLGGLPYDCLVHVLEFAASGLENDRKAPEEWLKQASLVCKRFTRPARAVTFRAMSLLDHYHARKLISYLKSLATGSKPRAWIQYLRIQAIPVLARKDQGEDPINLAELLKLLPMLRGLRLEINHDVPLRRSQGYGFGARSLNSVYQPSLINVLKEQQIHLRSIKWNYYFNRNSPFPWTQLAAIHKEPIFRRLEHVEVVWFNVFASVQNRDIFAQSLVDALNSSLSLKSLTLNGCQLRLGLDVLGALPKTLENLTFTDTAVHSVLLGQYLAECGGNLRSLRINYNRTIDLSFLGALDVNCPKLESLQYELSSISHQDSAVSSEGALQNLLPDGTIPTWPSSLQRVEMLYLRKWSLESAETFFKSFLQHAHKLPNLRALVLKATVNLDWKDRVKFRDKWTASLLKTFKRNVADPKPVNFYLPRNTGPPASKRLSSRRKTEASGSPSTRKRLRTATEDAPQSRRSSGRITRMRKEQESTPVTRSLDNDNQKAELDDIEHYQDYAIQGMCDVVDIRIENLHPAHVQFEEKDFLDSEPSGDEDWDGD